MLFNVLFPIINENYDGHIDKAMDQMIVSLFVLICNIIIQMGLNLLSLII